MTFPRPAVPAILCFLLSGCGGGGGGGVSTSDVLDTLSIDGKTREVVDVILDQNDDQQTANAAPTYTRSRDFNSHWGHRFSGVEEAYRRGITGKGVTVAVLDDGIQSSNPEFAGRMLSGFNAFTDRANGDPIVNNDCDGFGGCDTGRHGTMVAGVIGAAADGTGAHGVAPGVRLFSINIDTREDDGLFSSEESSNERAYDAALASGARIFNHSYAVSYDPSQRRAFERGGGGTYDRLIAAKRAGGVHVFATGNDGTDQPSMESLWPVWRPEIAGGIIAVTGIVEDGTTGRVRLASYANKCGDAQDWCLSAPTGDLGRNEQFVGLVAAAADGTTNRDEDPDGDGLGQTVGGTSAAAAYVSGTLALLKEAFPELTGEQIGLILLDTASDLGEAGTDAVYGRGAVNIAEAIKPQGTRSVASGVTLAEGTTPLSRTGLALNPAMAGANPLKGRSMVFFDGYGRAYDMEAEALVEKAAPYRDGLSRLGETLDGVRAAAPAPEDDRRFSFGVASEPLGLSARSAADAGALLMLVMQGRDGAVLAAENDQFRSGFLGLAPDATSSVLRYALSPRASLSLTMGSTHPMEGGDREDLATLDYAYAASDRLAFGLRAGMLHEKGGMLGSRGAGALSLSGGSTTRFLEGRVVRRMGDRIALIGEAGIGWTDPGAASPYLSYDGSLTSAEARIGLAMSDIGRAGDRLTVSGGIPLHVIDGTARTRLPTGRDAAGRIAYDTAETELGGDVPVEMRLDYAVPLSERLTVGLNGAVRRDADAEVYGDLAVGMRLDF